MDKIKFEGSGIPAFNVEITNTGIITNPSDLPNPNTKLENPNIVPLCSGRFTSPTNAKKFGASALMQIAARNANTNTMRKFGLNTNENIK